MKKKTGIIRSILLLVIILLMIVPVIQNRFKIIDIKPLSGAITKTEKTYIHLNDWFSGDYQTNEEKYLNETFGFREFFVRLNNQVAFSLFKKSSAQQVVLGKDGCLFEENYIKAYYGEDYIGVDSLTHRMQKLKFITDTLRKLNKNIILIFAPGKASFFPEYIPDTCKRPIGPTNYGYSVQLAKEYGLNYIDFKSYFIDHKKTSPYPLYPRCGIHWSFYGECIVADSIIRYIERLRKIDMVNIWWNRVVTDDPRDRDNDVGDAMNLLFGLKPYKMGYPVLQYEDEKGKVKPTVLVVADSYYWGMYGVGLDSAFGDNHFWYYNKEVYPQTYKATLLTKQLNFKDEIAHHDVILIMTCEANLSKMGWGFIEKLYSFFKGRPV
jgi:hypothetical protein